jgi:hypothetical protein
MWVITLYQDKDIKMFEFDTETEAREAFKVMVGVKFLTEEINIDVPSPKEEILQRN